MFCHNHPIFTSVFIPGDEGYFSAPPDGFRVKVKINSKGLRDKEYTYEKPEGTYRILILGDSITAGLAVPLEKLFSEIFEKKLNDNPNKKFEVINAGVPARSIREEKKFYELEGYKYKADLVLLAFYIGNDVRLKNQQTSEIKVVDNRIVPKQSEGFIGNVKAVLSHSQVYIFLGNILPTVLPGLSGLLRNKGLMTKPWFNDVYIFAVKYPDFVTEGWMEAKKNILELRKEIIKNNAKFAFLIIPAVQQVEKYLWQELIDSESDKKNLKWDLDKPNKEMSAFLIQNNIPYLDVLKHFREVNTNARKRLYLKFDRHLNLYGHKVISDKLADWFWKEIYAKK
jgi:lysophospholipase L1-like esterase